MTTEPRREHGPTAARQAVGEGIQNLAAARLGRGFVPMAVAAAGGGLALLTGQPDRLSWLVLLIGGPLAALAMLAYGMRTVQRAFGRPPRPWMALASVGSALPLGLGAYLVGWLGLRRLADPDGIVSVAVAILAGAVGVWVLRSWMRVVEIEGLTRVVATDLDDIGGPA